MKKWLKIALYFLSGAVVVWLTYRIAYKSPPSESDPAAKQKEVLSQAATAGPNAKRDLVLKNFSWQKAEDGSAVFHSFSIYNASTRYIYSAITVRFSYYSEIGDEVGHSDKIIETVIKAGESIRIDKLKTDFLNQHADGADMTILK
jgi:hypothetical protein